MLRAHLNESRYTTVKSLLEQNDRHFVKFNCNSITQWQTRCAVRTYTVVSCKMLCTSGSSKMVT